MNNLREIWIPTVELRKLYDNPGIDIYPYNDKSHEPLRISILDDQRLNIHTKSGACRYASTIITPDGVGDSLVLNYGIDGTLKVWVNIVNLEVLNNPVRRILSKTVVPQTMFREEMEYGKVFKDEYERLPDLRGTYMSLVSATSKRPKHKKISGFELMYVFQYASSNSDLKRIKRIYGCGKYSQKSLDWFSAEMTQFMIRPSGAFDHIPEAAEIQKIVEPKKVATQIKKPKPTVLTLPCNMQIATATPQPLQPEDLKKNPRINPAMSALAALLPQVQSSAESV